VKSKLTVRFELRDQSGTAVWHDTFSGRASAETALGTSEFVGQMFAKAVEDLIRQLLLDSGFRSIFENRQGGG